jgi:hypothetical protein
MAPGVQGWVNAFAFLPKRRKLGSELCTAKNAANSEIWEALRKE